MTLGHNLLLSPPIVETANRALAWQELVSQVVFPLVHALLTPTQVHFMLPAACRGWKLFSP